MNKSLASVLKLITVLMMAFMVVGSFNSFAADEKDKNNNDSQAKINAAKEVCGDDKECYKQYLDKIISGTSGDKCSEANKELTQAISKFNEACAKASIPNCVNDVKRCQECMAGEGDKCGEASYPGMSEDSPSEAMSKIREAFGSGISGYDDSTKIVNIDKVRVKYKNCPAMAGSDYKDLKKEVEEGQKKIDELRLKIPKLNQELLEIKSNAESERQKNQDKLNEAQENWQKTRDEIDQKLFKDREELRAQLQKLRDEYNKGQDAITQVGWKKTDAKRSLNEKLSALRLKCNEMALNQVQGERAIKFEKMKKGEYSVSQQNLYSRAGQTEHQYFQNQASDYYNKCINSTFFTEGRDNYQREYEDAIKAYDNQIESLNRERQNIKEQMDHISQANSEQENQQYQQAISRADTAYQNKYNSITNAQKVIDDKATTAMQVKNQEIMLAMSQLQREESYLKQKQQLLALKRNYTDGDSDAKSSDISGAMNYYSQAVGAATDIQMSCCGGAAKEKEAYCQKANRFLGGSTSSDGESGVTVKDAKPAGPSKASQ